MKIFLGVVISAVMIITLCACGEAVNSNHLTSALESSSESSVVYQPIEEEDLEQIAQYYFDLKLTDTGIEWKMWIRQEDIIINSTSSYCLSAVDADDNVLYTLAILKDGSGVYSYGLTTGKSVYIGESDIKK